MGLNQGHELHAGVLPAWDRQELGTLAHHILSGSMLHGLYIKCVSVLRVAFFGFPQKNGSPVVPFDPFFGRVPLLKYFK